MIKGIQQKLPGQPPSEGSSIPEEIIYLAIRNLLWVVGGTMATILFIYGGTTLFVFPVLLYHFVENGTIVTGALNAAFSELPFKWQLIQAIWLGVLLSLFAATLQSILKRL